MPVVVTTVHDPRAVVAACRAVGLARPVERGQWWEGREVYGWVVRLPRLRFPIICDTLRGLIFYHAVDNAFPRYAHLMRFVHRCYDFQADLRRRGNAPAAPGCQRRVPAGQVA
jgi:hypothetical protein